MDLIQQVYGCMFFRTVNERTTTTRLGEEISPIIANTSNTDADENKYADADTDADENNTR